MQLAAFSVIRLLAKATEYGNVHGPSHKTLGQHQVAQSGWYVI